MPKSIDAKSYQWFWDHLDSYLAGKQLKQTQQRRLVAGFFVDYDCHATAEDIHEKTKKAGHNFGLATIYRTLNLLVEAGLAEQRSFLDGRNVYEVSHPGEHHDHLICIDCGKIVEFENETIEKLQLKIAEEHGFELVNHRLDLYGHCDNCSKSRPKRVVKI